MVECRARLQDAQMKTKKGSQVDWTGKASRTLYIELSQSTSSMSPHRGAGRPPCSCEEPAAGPPLNEDGNPAALVPKGGGCGGGGGGGVDVFND
jgi:hypothetical protein